MIHTKPLRSFEIRCLDGFASAISVLVFGLLCQIADAQESSLLRQPGPPPVANAPNASLQPLPMPHQAPGPYSTPPQASYTASPGAPALLSNVSWTYQPAPRLRTFQKNDIITIRVDEITSVTATGAAENRKKTLYEAILTDWIRLTDFRLRPDPQGNGDPAVAAESESQFRSQASLKSREAMTFNIAATVVDIRPNGNLVVEARKTIRINDNLWETSLSGICRAQDIAPDNVILSRDLIDLEIRKEDQGHLRDGYKRGWFSRWFDRVQPF
ncbi:flagellar basal body L-ring protein FlgH [Novipirellula sp.]|uniref:flagellar basal body L-ring protein FlgH n=1 Tax=Novipirellula sp. TaxID=2795430 RepID=UPI00356150E5